MKGYWADFQEPPPLGTVIERGFRANPKRYRLVGIVPHVRTADGEETAILRWVDSSGQIWTSGLHSKSPSREYDHGTDS